MAKIELKNISKTYKNTPVLKEIDLVFEEQTIYGLLGRNGAGKSTLLNIINNRVFANAGSISYGGNPHMDKDEIQRHLFLTSESDLYPEKMKIKAILSWTAAFYNDFDMDYALELSQKFNLDLKKKYGKLSTGYRSITKLILALCVPCEYIFLDEPVLGLDATHRELFYQELIQTYTEHPRTFIISTHLIEEITNLLEKIVVLDHGKIIINESTDYLLAHAKAISGQREEVEQATESLQLLGYEELGNYRTAYTMAAFEKADLPTTVTVESMNLQQLFVQLTKEEREVL